MNPKPTAISCFSGCGGMDLGASRAGFTIVAANDNWDLATLSYQSNFPGHECICSDIHDFASYCGEKVRADGAQVDVVFGGPPCPPYSKSRFYRMDKPRGVDDPEGLSTLKGFLALVEQCKPRAFVFENVAGFAFKPHRRGLEMLTRTAKDLGYETSHSVLNAADFGVPQIRERFFMVGSRKGVFGFPEPTHSKTAPDDLFASREPWVTCGEVLSDLFDVVPEFDAAHRAGGKDHELLRMVPPGDNYLFFTEEKGCPDPKFKWRSRYWSFLLKLDPERPAWTIQARRSNNMGPFHWDSRILHIKEICRLQTFPDDWVLHGSIEKQWRQIGNAVPPRLAQAIFKAVLDHLESDLGQ